MFLSVNYGLNFNFACQWHENTSKWVFQQTNNFARASRFFVHFYSVSARLIKTWKCLILRFMEDVNKRRRIFLFLNLSAVPKKWAFIWSFQNVWKKREFILKVAFSLLLPTLVDQWMDPGSSGGFRQTVLQVQSPQRSSCHSNILTWGQASPCNWRFCCVSKKELQPPESWTEVETGNDEGPSPLAPSPIVFFFVLISAFARQNLTSRDNRKNTKKTANYAG